MKAWVYRRYGGPEVLEAVEAPKPAPGEGEVLVRLAATSINAADYRQLRADPFLVRIDNGLNRPKKRTILGGDVAGVVEELGPGVGSFAAGDAVFGETKLGGAFAEYTIVKEELLVRPAVFLGDRDTEYGSKPFRARLEVWGRFYF